MKSNTLRIVIVLALIVGVALVIASKEKPSDQPPTVAQSPTVETQPLSAAKLPKMLELGSTTCTPCKMMEKVLDELRESYPDTLIVEFVDVEKSPDVAKKYKIEVIPTQIFLDADGKEFYRHEAFFPKDDIVDVFERHGFKLSK